MYTHSIVCTMYACSITIFIAFCDDTILLIVYLYIQNSKKVLRTAVTCTFTIFYYYVKSYYFILLSILQGFLLFLILGFH